MADAARGLITDEAMSMVAQTNPELSNHQIGCKLKDMGVIAHPNSVYKRLKKSDYLRAEITQIRANHREKASRELTPLALDIHKKALKSKELTIKEKREWVSMAEKLELGEDRLPGMTVDKIQIAQLQVYQTLVSDNMDKG